MITFIIFDYNTHINTSGVFIIYVTYQRPNIYFFSGCHTICNSPREVLYGQSPINVHILLELNE